MSEAALRQKLIQLIQQFGYSTVANNLQIAYLEASETVQSELDKNRSRCREVIVDNPISSSVAQ